MHTQLHKFETRAMIADVSKIIKIPKVLFQILMRTLLLKMNITNHPIALHQLVEEKFPVVH